MLEYIAFIGVVITIWCITFRMKMISIHQLLGRETLRASSEYLSKNKRP